MPPWFMPSSRASLQLNRQGAVSPDFRPAGLAGSGILAGMPSRRRPESKTTTSREPARTRKIDLRVSDAERAALEARAGRQPLGAYIRGALFPANDNTPLPRCSGGISQGDRKLLAQVLGKLGQSGMSQALREMREAARSGSLIVDEEMLARFDQGLADLRAIKSLLMRALGVRER